MRKVTHEQTYNGLHLYSYGKSKQGFYVEIIQAIESLITSMLRKHNQVFVAMFVLSLPANSGHFYPTDNTLIKRFSEALITHFKRRVSNPNKPQRYDPKYLWVREISPKTGQLHYHFMLLLNADCIQNDSIVMEQIEKYWGMCLNIGDPRGYVERCDPCSIKGGLKIRRKDPLFQQVYAEFFKYATYLAKCYSKVKTTDHVKRIGHSKLF